MNQNPTPQDRFHCPLCGYTSTVAGQCPTHKVPLLGFSTWIEFKRRRNDSQQSFLWPILIVVFVFVAGFVVYKMAVKTVAGPAVLMPGE